MGPHIFAVADLAYHNMLQNQENQSILVTGESGAGKTENTKKVIQYLTSVAVDRTVDKHLQDNLDQQILRANPILEAFGNAQTIRNNNSSRFGKFIRIEFSSEGEIAGANVLKYLFEKSRVSNQSSDERNYHIFYQFMKGASNEEKSKFFNIEKLLIEDDMNAYSYIKNSKKEIPGVDDKVEYKILKEAMDIMNFSNELQHDFNKVIASVLHIGNIVPVKDRDDQAHLRDMSQVEKLSHILCISPTEFAKSLLRPEIKAGNDWIAQSRTVGQVLHSLESLAKAMYERMFENLLEQINKTVNRTDKQKDTFIGVLDIAGFEIFEVNSLEQLWINYTNEKLQQFFNHHMFEKEQEEYQKEDIKWDFIDFGLDLQPTIDLIEKANPIGVLSCLDEECVMPKATDKTFTEKLNSIWKNNNQKYEELKFKLGFNIYHYASKVEYITDGWLDKNKDPLNNNTVKIIALSSDKFISSLFQDFREEKSSSFIRKSLTKKGAFRTVSQRHKEQLSLLMNQLNSTEPHFVRCILPNDEKKPAKINIPLVIGQLRCNGVLEGIRICRAGFPNKMMFSDFRHRYEILAPIASNTGFMDGKRATKLILREIELDESQYRVGTSKVFFRAGVLAVLEEVRDEKLSKIICESQALCRGFISRYKYYRKSNQLKAIMIIQKNVRIYTKLREWAWWRLYTKVKPLLNVTRVDEELKVRDNEINDLKSDLQKTKNGYKRLQEQYEFLNVEKQKLEESLYSERNIAVDNQEILRRTQERKIALEDELNLSLKELEKMDHLIEEAYKLQNIAEKESSISKDNLQKELEKNKQLTSQINEYTNIFDSIQDEKDKLMLELNQTINDNKSNQEKIKQLELELIQKDEERQELNKIYESKLQKMEKTISENIENIGKREAISNEANSKIEEITKEHIRQLEENDKLKSLLKTDKEKISNLEMLLKNKEVSTLEYENMVNELKSEVNVLNNQLKETRLDKENLKSEKTKTEKELTELRKAIENKGNQEIEMRSISKSREVQIEDMTKLNEKLKKEISDYKINNNKEFEKIKNDLQVQINVNANLKQEIEEYLIKINDLDRNNTSNELKVVNLNKELNVLEEEFKKVSIMHSKLGKDYNEKNKENSFFEEQTTYYKQELEKTQMQLAQVSKEKNMAQNNYLQLKSNCENHCLKIQALEKTNDKQNSRIKDLQCGIKDYELSLKELNDLFASKNEQINTLRADFKKENDEKLKSSKEQKTVLENEIKELNIIINQVSNKNSLLEKTKSRLENEIEDTKHQLQKVRSEWNEYEKKSRITEEENKKLVQMLNKETNQNEHVKVELNKLRNNNQTLKTQFDNKCNAFEALSKSKAEIELEFKKFIDEMKADSDTYEIEKLKINKEKSTAMLQSKISEVELNFKRAEEEKSRLEEILESTKFENNKLIGEKDYKINELRRLLMLEIEHLGKRLEEELESKEEEVLIRNKLEAEINEINKKASDQEKGKMEVDTIKSKYEEIIKELQKQIANEEKLKEDFESLALRQESKSDSLQSEVEKLELQIHGLLAIKRKNENIIKELKEEVEEGRKDHSHVHKVDVLEKEVQYLKNKTEELKKYIKELENQETNKRTRELTSQQVPAEQYKKIEESSKAMLVSQRILQQELDKKKNEIESLQKSNDEYLKDILEYKNKLEDVSIYRDEIEKLNSQIDEFYNIHEIDTEKIQDVEFEVERIKTLLDKANSQIDQERITIKSYAKKEKEYLDKIEELDYAIQSYSKNKEGYLKRIKSLESDLNDTNLKLLDKSNPDNEQITYYKEQYELLKRSTIEGFEDRDKIIESMKDKYQSQLGQISVDLESEKQSSLKFLEANSQLRQEIEEYNEKMRDFNNKLSEEEGIRAALEHRYESIKQTNNSLLLKCNQYKEKTNTLEHENDNLKNKIEVLETQVKNITKHSNQLEIKLAKLDNSEEEISGKETASLKENKVDSLHSQLNNYKQRTQKLNSLNKQLELELENNKSELVELRKLNIKLEKEFHENNIKLIDLESRFSLDKNMSETISKFSLPETPDSFINDNNINAQLTKKCKSYESKIKDLEFSLEIKNSELEHSSKNMQKLSKKIENLKQELNDLENKDNQSLIVKNKFERELRELKDNNTKLQRDVTRFRRSTTRNSSYLSGGGSFEKPVIRNITHTRDTSHNTQLDVVNEQENSIKEEKSSSSRNNNIQN